MITVEAVRELAVKAQSMPVHPDVRFPPSLYYRFLQAYCERMKPTVCVELGLCGGGASLHMCIGTPGVVIGVDIVNDYPERIAYIQDRFDNFRFYQCDSIEAYGWFIVNTLGTMTHGDDPKVDLLFIDTVHTYERAMAEYNEWKYALADDAIICLDDLYLPDMERVWDELPGEKVRLDHLHDQRSPKGGGFGVVLCNQK